MKLWGHFGDEGRISSQNNLVFMKDTELWVGHDLQLIWLVEPLELVKVEPPPLKAIYVCCQETQQLSEGRALCYLGYQMYSLLNTFSNQENWHLGRIQHHTQVFYLLGWRLCTLVQADQETVLYQSLYRDLRVWNFTGLRTGANQQIIEVWMDINPLWMERCYWNDQKIGLPPGLPLRVMSAAEGWPRRVKAKGSVAPSVQISQGPRPSLSLIPGFDKNFVKSCTKELLTLKEIWRDNQFRTYVSLPSSEPLASCSHH